MTPTERRRRAQRAAVVRRAEISLLVGFRRAEQGGVVAPVPVAPVEPVVVALPEPVLIAVPDVLAEVVSSAVSVDVSVDLVAGVGGSAVFAADVSGGSPSLLHAV